MKLSKQSIKRYMGYVMGIDEPFLCFHQTLTFYPKVEDENHAQTLFQELMDNLHNQPRFHSMASVYFRDVHENGGVHYHVLLYFFDEASLPFPRSRMYERLRTVIFSPWKAKQEGKLAYIANLLEERTPDYGYFLDKLTLAGKGERTTRPKVRWWNVWNKRLVDRHWHPVSKARIDAQFKLRFGGTTTLPVNLCASAIPIRRYTKENIRAMREDIEVDLDGPSWSEHKRQVTGLPGKVTNEQFRAFLNERLKADRAKQAGG